MDIFLILIIIFIIFTVFRTYLRGAIIGAMDTLTLVLSTVFATKMFGRLGYMLHSTQFYADARKAISGMINFNSVIDNTYNTTNTTEDISYFPEILTDYINKNNITEVYRRIGVNNFDDYIIDVFAHIITISVAFFILFFVAFGVLYVIRIMIMPYMNIVDFGVLDNIIAIILGFFKSILLIFLVLSFVQILILEFNYATVFLILDESPILSYLYSINPILKSLLNGVYLR